MVRQDQRRSNAEKVILGFLAHKYEPPGSSYQQIIVGTEPEFKAISGRQPLSLRQTIRHLSELQERRLVGGEIVAGSRRFLITRKGYVHYHGTIEGHTSVKTLEVVPDELFPPLMAKGIWRLTGDQARYFREYLAQKGSLLVLLPAGAGKTIVAMIEAYRHYRHDSSQSRILYLSPFKAINSQSTDEFRNVLGRLGMIIERQDGDHRTPKQKLLSANLVVSTFESAQFALYRGDEWLQRVGLVIIDELTILDATRATPQGGLRLPRGANLDLLITSLMHSFNTNERKLRFVCLGIPNASQPALQSWFGGGTTMLNPSERFERYEEKVAVFDKHDGQETCRIERKDGVLSEAPFELSSTGEMQRMLTVVLHYLKKGYQLSRDGKIKPLLVFVRARKDASGLAGNLANLIDRDPHLSELMKKGRTDNAYRINRSAIIESSTVKQLTGVVNFGIAFHHAGLFHAQRRLVEEMMNDGSLSVLFATTTLTHGVDLPIGAVMVDAQLLRMLGYSRLEYVQLRGRVDHKDPFHETTGTADIVVVMSQNNVGEDYDRIRELLQGVDPPLDSQSLGPLNARMFMLQGLQYLLSRSEQVSADELTDLAKASYYLQKGPSHPTETKPFIPIYAQIQSDKALRWCERNSIVTVSGKKFSLGVMGKIANQTGLGFEDVSLISGRVNRILSSNEDSKLTDLLVLAVSLTGSSDEVSESLPRVRLLESVPSRMRKEIKRLVSGGIGLHHGVRVALIHKWIEERPISEIVMDTPEFQVYESGLLTAVRAVARNLNNIAKVFERLGPVRANGRMARAFDELAQTARLLALRVRYGIRSDIATSELGKLAFMVDLDDLVNSRGDPELLMRIVLRLMVQKQWATGESIRQYRGKNPIRDRDLDHYDLDPQTAEHMKLHRHDLNEVALRIIRLAIKQNDQSSQARTLQS